MFLNLEAYVESDNSYFEEFQGIDTLEVFPIIEEYMESANNLIIACIRAEVAIEQGSLNESLEAVAESFMKKMKDQIIAFFQRIWEWIKRVFASIKRFLNRVRNKAEKEFFRNSKFDFEFDSKKWEDIIDELYREYRRKAGQGQYRDTAEQEQVYNNIKDLLNQARQKYENSSQDTSLKQVKIYRNIINFVFKDNSTKLLDMVDNKLKLLNQTNIEHQVKFFENPDSSGEVQRYILAETVTAPLDNKLRGEILEILDSVKSPVLRIENHIQSLFVNLRKYFKSIKETQSINQEFNKTVQTLVSDLNKIIVSTGNCMTLVIKNTSNIFETEIKEFKEKKQVMKEILDKINAEIQKSQQSKVIYQKAFNKMVASFN